jgi:hypothetical protein
MSKVVRKVISGKLFYQYDNVKYFDPLPKTFHSFQHYFDRWSWLCEFELMNILLHSRRGDSKAETSAAAATDMNIRRA